MIDIDKNSVEASDMITKQSVKSTDRREARAFFAGLQVAARKVDQSVRLQYAWVERTNARNS